MSTEITCYTSQKATDITWVSREQVRANVLVSGIKRFSEVCNYVVSVNCKLAYSAPRPSTGVDEGFLPVSENRTLLSAFLRQCDSTRLHGREIKTCGLLAWSVQSNGTDHRNVRQKVKTTNRCESANNPDTQICRWVTTKTVSVCLCVGGWCGVGDTSARTTSYVYCWVGLLAIANNGAEKPINY